MQDTKIQWCDDTVNFWFGCSKVSEACKNCYAEAWAKRFKKNIFGENQRYIRLQKAIAEIDKIAKRSFREKRNRVVFVNSMSDFFEDLPELEEVRDYAFTKLRFTANLIFLLLTKRPQNISSDMAYLGKRLAI